MTEPFQSTHASAALLVAAAGCFIGLGEECDRAAGDRGQVVEHFYRSAPRPMNPPHPDWSTAFVNYVGYWSHYDHPARQSTWPLPPLATCDAIAAYALERELLLEDTAELGDIFVRCNGQKRFVRAGIVIATVCVGQHMNTGRPYFDCDVIEGNSNIDGTVGGPHIVRVARRLSMPIGDRLIRWTLLAERAGTDGIITLVTGDDGQPRRAA
jgi:hypothetical protein